MRLHLKNYPPFVDATLDLPDTGIVAIFGENGAGKSSLLEAFCTAVHGKTLRGSSPWRLPSSSFLLELPQLSLKRTKEQLLLNEHGALKPSKKQPDVTSLFGEFTLWRRVRVFDADLTSRFGAETDSGRKKLLERLLGLEQYEAAQKKCSSDLRQTATEVRSATHELELVWAQLSEQPPAVEAPSPSALTDAAKHLARLEAELLEMAKRNGAAEAIMADFAKKQRLFASGKCPTCMAPVQSPQLPVVPQLPPVADLEAERKAAREALGTLQQQQQLFQAWHRAQSRVASLEKARETKQAALAALQLKHGRLVLANSFFENVRPQLLVDSLRGLQRIARAWVPNLQLEIDGDDLRIFLGERSYLELNEGHRRLCDLAVLLGLSAMDPPPVPGPIWLDGALHGLDAARQDLVLQLLEVVAEKELVIILTCCAATIQRIRGVHVTVTNGQLLTNGRGRVTL